MRDAIKLTIASLCIVGIFVCTVVSQKPSKTGLQRDAKLSDANGYEGWKKIELKSFSFYAPKDLKRIEQKCIDSECYYFKSEKFSLDVDVHIDTQYPTLATKFPDYREKYIEVGGAVAWIWAFKDERTSTYENGVRFMFRNDRNRAATMTVISKDSNVSSTAEKIFLSVEFKEKN